jgi:hypothetical protein
MPPIESGSPPIPARTAWPLHSRGGRDRARGACLWLRAAAPDGRRAHASAARLRDQDALGTSTRLRDHRAMRSWLGRPRP